MKIGILREGKVPPDRRAPLTPAQCLDVARQYPKVGISVQPSPIRCFSDDEYTAAGFAPVEDLGRCDILLGIKEVPIDALLPDKTYLFFSHTIKKQAHNRELLQALLAKNIRMVDYETLVDERGERIIAFGRYAGLVGAYNGLRTYGERFGLYDLKPAHQCLDRHEVFQRAKAISLPPIKIAITGGGRVAKGAVELLDSAGIRRVEPEAYLTGHFGDAVYTQLNSQHYHRHKRGLPFEAPEFYRNPQDYHGEFWPYACQTDLLIAAAFWHPSAPVLFTREAMLDPAFRIQVIADVTCDIEGSIPSTVRASHIANPVYDFDPLTGIEASPYSHARHISVMAIDNLPGELPRDASEDFGRVLVDKVLPHLLHPGGELIRRATITQAGALTPRFAYLQDYVDGEVALVG
jgi:saccharopine dehydrogenase (NAD+, L-lysine forming)